MTGPRFNYEPESSVVRFDDLPGLEVFMGPVSFGEALEMAKLGDKVTAGDTSQIERLIDMFAARLESWNLDVRGKPVPATAEGVRSLDTSLVLKIFTGWFEGMTRAPKASTKPAEPGGGLTVQDLPMAPLRAV